MDNALVEDRLITRCIGLFKQNKCNGLAVGNTRARHCGEGQTADSCLFLQVFYSISILIPVYKLYFLKGCKTNNKQKTTLCL